MDPSTTLGGAVVTGAGRGLGKEIARLLVDRGHLVLVTDIDEATARTTAAELGERAVARALDVRDHAAVRRPATTWWPAPGASTCGSTTLAC